MVMGGLPFERHLSARSLRMCVCGWVGGSAPRRVGACSRAPYIHTYRSYICTSERLPYRAETREVVLAQVPGVYASLTRVARHARSSTPYFVHSNPTVILPRPTRRLPFASVGALLF